MTPPVPLAAPDLNPSLLDLLTLRFDPLVWLPLLPALYLLSSLLVWAVVLRPLPSVQPAGIGSRGWFGFLAALPMMAVAAVWLYSRQVLYTPYVSALCLWDLTPLQNQQISGWIMMLAGLPALALALVQLMAWLIQLADSGTQPPAARG